MGYAFVTSPCLACGRIFSYNPHAVPSVPVDLRTGKPAEDGIRQPLCRECVEAANPIRVENGLDPIVIREGAYEPLEEGEL